MWEWRQGAKDIGGEVKIRSIEKAQMLKKRGCIVLPDPMGPEVIRAFEKKAFREFERHSRVGMVSEEAFGKRVEELAIAGANSCSPLHSYHFLYLFILVDLQKLL